MRIALFAPYFPAPAFTGGRIRIQHFARALAQRAELHLFAQASAREAGDARAQQDSAMYARVHTVPAGFVLPAWGPTATPQRVRRGSPARLRKVFFASHAREPFDLIVVAHCHAAAAAMQAGLPWLLDEHNIESDYLEAKLRAAGALRPWHQRELRRLRQWESLCWRAANEVVAVTPQDAERIGSGRSAAAVHIPNGVDVSSAVYSDPEERRAAQVLFVGLMDHPPNVQAAQLLANEIMPRVWAVRPDAQLVLCGANPARAVLRLAGPRVIVTGRLPTLAPFLAQARVFANCLTLGAGSSLKVLEALAVGLPLVSTRAGVRGFALQPSEHYLAAETAAEHAAAIVRCLADASDMREMSQRARAGRVFAEAHGWQSLSERFAELAMRTALAARPSAALERQDLLLEHLEERRS